MDFNVISENKQNSSQLSRNPVRETRFQWLHVCVSILVEEFIKIGSYCYKIFLNSPILHLILGVYYITLGEY